MGVLLPRPRYAINAKSGGGSSVEGQIGSGNACGDANFKQYIDEPMSGIETPYGHYEQHVHA